MPVEYATLALIWARSAAEAAGRYVEGQEMLAEGGVVHVCVRGPGDSSVERFEVTGEATMVYSARAVELSAPSLVGAEVE